MRFTEIPKKILNYIGGELIEPLGTEYFDNIDPATGKVYSAIPDSQSADIELAFQAANAAFEAWSTQSIERRSAVINRIADLIEQNLDFLAQAESIDNGKPISLARAVDIPRAVSNFRFFANAIQHESTETHATSAQLLNYTIRQPLGVVACISPWNLPLYLFSWKIAPALASGNCVVAKPSEVTPMTAYLLSEICIAAGLPAGVLNIVYGYGHSAGQALVEHNGIQAVSFTGGTETGKKIASIIAPKFKKMSLELGGKNPNIVFADADLDKAVSGSVLASFANQGQICLCGSRLFVQREIYDEFRNRFLQKVKNLKVGDPKLPETKTGAVVSESHMNKVLSWIEKAQKEGGTISAGGNRVQLDDRCSEGFFIEPTVIEGLDAYCQTNQNEIFGPVVSMIPFDTEEEVISWANCTEYGLAASIWTTDLSKAHRVAGKIESGIVWVNCWLKRDLRTPFGGIKNSGVGREGGWEALHFFTEPKNICIQIDQ